MDSLNKSELFISLAPQSYKFIFHKHRRQTQLSNCCIRRCDFIEKPMRKKIVIVKKNKINEIAHRRFNRKNFKGCSWAEQFAGKPNLNPKAINLLRRNLANMPRLQNMLKVIGRNIYLDLKTFNGLRSKLRALPIDSQNDLIGILKKQHPFEGSDCHLSRDEKQPILEIQSQFKLFTDHIAKIKSNIDISKDYHNQIEMQIFQLVNEICSSKHFNENVGLKTIENLLENLFSFIAKELYNNQSNLVFCNRIYFILVNISSKYPLFGKNLHIFFRHTLYYPANINFNSLRLIINKLVCLNVDVYNIAFELLNYLNKNSHTTAIIPWFHSLAQLVDKLTLVPEKLKLIFPVVQELLFSCVNNKMFIQELYNKNKTAITPYFKLWNLLNSQKFKTNKNFIVYLQHFDNHLSYNDASAFLNKINISDNWPHAMSALFEILNQNNYNLHKAERLMEFIVSNSGKVDLHLLINTHTLDFIKLISQPHNRTLYAYKHELFMEFFENFINRCANKHYEVVILILIGIMNYDLNGIKSWHKIFEYIKSALNSLDFSLISSLQEFFNYLYAKDYARYDQLSQWLVEGIENVNLCEERMTEQAVKSMLEYPQIFSYLTKHRQIHNCSQGIIRYAFRHKLKDFFDKKNLLKDIDNFYLTMRFLFNCLDKTGIGIYEDKSLLNEKINECKQLRVYFTDQSNKLENNSKSKLFIYTARLIKDMKTMLKDEGRKCSNSMHIFPFEIQDMILNHLPADKRIGIARVCKLWNLFASTIYVEKIPEGMIPSDVH